MAGEAAAWRATALEIFAAFGDAVKDVDVTTYSGDKTYDATLGKNVRSGTATTAKLAIIMLGQTKFQKVFGPTTWIEGNITGYMTPLAAGTLKISDEVEDEDDNRYVVDKIADPTGVGAYYVVYLRPVSNA